MPERNCEALLERGHETRGMIGLPQGGCEAPVAALDLEGLADAQKGNPHVHLEPDLRVFSLTPSVAFVWRRFRDTFAHVIGASLGGNLAHAAGGSFGLKVINAALAFGVSVLLARLLGVEGFGIVAFAMAMVTILEIPAQIGLPSLAIRYVSAYAARAQWGLLLGLLRWANGAVLASATLAAALLLAAVWQLDLAGTEARWPLTIGALLVPLTALSAMREGTLRGFRWVVLSQVPEMLVQPLLFVGLLGLAIWVLTLELDPTMAMIFRLVAAAGSFTLGAWLLWRFAPAEIRNVEPVYDRRVWIGATLPFLMMGGVSVMQSQIGTLMLGLLREAEEVGIYRAAYNMASLAGFGVMAITTASAPTLSRLYAMGERDKVQLLVVLSAQIAFLIGLPVVVVLAAAGRFILGVCFGPEFAAGYVPLLIIAIGQLVNSLMVPVGVILAMTDRQRYSLHALAIAAGVNLVLNLLLVPAGGPVGAAMAAVLAISLQYVVLIRLASKHLDLQITPFRFP